jgi:hypothetical protein
MGGVLDAIDQAAPSRRTVEMILNSSLEDEWLSLKASLADAAEQDVRSAEEGASLARPATTAKVTRMEEIREDVEASRVYFVFERIGWEERVALQIEHQPREGNRLDAIQGFNIETYTPAIIRLACIGARKDPDPHGEVTEIPEDRWLRLLGGTDPEGRKIKGSLNYGQVNRLFGAAHTVNEGIAKVPTSARFLLETPDSGASLAQPSPGPDQVPSASKGGSRRTSPRSSTAKRAAPKKAGSSAS